MNTNIFAIVSNGGKLLSGAMYETNGFEQVNYSEDFLNALAASEYAIFIPENEKDIGCLYDETNIHSTCPLANRASAMQWTNWLPPELH